MTTSDIGAIISAEVTTVDPIENEDDLPQPDENDGDQAEAPPFEEED